jgi:hypothetical protein
MATVPRADVGLAVVGLRLLRLRSLQIAFRTRFPDERARLRKDAARCKTLADKLEEARRA